MENKGPLAIKELKGINPGKQVWGKFLLIDKIHRKTKDGKDMYNIKIGDVSGEMDAVVWENCAVAGNLEIGSVIALLGDLGSFNGKTQITAKRIKVLDEDPHPYLKGPEISMEELKQRFEKHIDSIQDTYLASLLEHIFTPSLKEKFFLTPAARSIHHNYAGGLLEHTVSVADLCLKAVKVYPQLNQDIVIAGALIHDIGKISEFEIKVIPQYTPEGRMMGHIVMGHEILSTAIKVIKDQGLDFPIELEWMLKNMLLSHHGSLEFGSPVLPLFPEAYLLHTMDNLDAKMYVFFNKIEEGEGESPLFTNYNNFFGQHFFKYRYSIPDKSQSDENEKD